MLVNDSERNEFFCRKLNETINQNKLDSEKMYVFSHMKTICLRNEHTKGWCFT